MITLRAEARIALPDPAAVLCPLCEHLLEHEAEISEAGGVTTIRFGDSRAELRTEPGARSIVIEEPCEIWRARWLARSTSSKRLSTLSMQSSTVTRAIACPLGVLMSWIRAPCDVRGAQGLL